MYNQEVSKISKEESDLAEQTGIDSSKYLLEDIETNNTQKIADLITNEAIDNNFGVSKDDMSVITCKFIKSENL